MAAMLGAFVLWLLATGKAKDWVTLIITPKGAK